MSKVTGNQLRPLLDPWVKTKAQRSRETAETYRRRVCEFLNFVGDRPLDGDSISAYLESIEHMTPGARAAYISAVRSFLRHGQAIENPETGAPYVDKSPVEWLVRPHVAVTSRNRYLTAEEARAVLAAAQKRSPTCYAVTLLLAKTGLRVGEVARAEWRHVYRDPHGNLGLLVQGKGGKQREVPLDHDLILALLAASGRDAIEVDQGDALKLSTTDTSPLIPNRWGERFVVTGLERQVKRAVADSGIEKPATPHWLRHSFATLAVLGGATVFQLRDTLGHAKLETSQLYVHWVEGLAQSAAHHLPPLT